MRPSFLNCEKPIIVAMIQCSTPKDCIEKIKLSSKDGAEAFGIQLCRIKREYRTKEHLTDIFNACDGKPIYVTSYRHSESEGYTDDECAELLLLALECGATLLDVCGDMFERSPHYELATDESAVNKQIALIDEIHKRGGEVLMSSHTLKSITLEENLMIAREHIKRGADVIKIVNKAEDKSEIPVYLEAIQRITKMTDKKLLLLVSGEGQIVRYIGANFGVCMYLCVQSHGPYDTPEQPLIKDIVALRNAIKL